MYDHIGIKVKNLDASVKFYSAALQPLGIVLCSRDDVSAGFGPPGAPALWIGVNAQANGKGFHIAFASQDRSAVDRFFKAGVEAGGRDNGQPGLRPDYGATYYAAFLFDPDGYNVEAVCLK